MAGMMTEDDLRDAMRADADAGRARWRRVNGLAHGREHSPNDCPKVAARRQAVAAMSSRGMDVTAISASLGVCKSTVQSDRAFAKTEGWL